MENRTHVSVIVVSADDPAMPGHQQTECNQAWVIHINSTDSWYEANRHWLRWWLFPYSTMIKMLLRTFPGELPYSLMADELAHHSREKMAGTMTTNSRIFSLIKKRLLQDIQKLQYFWCLINDKSALFLITVWHPIDHKPLSKPLMTQFVDKYMRHLSIMS